MGLLGLRVLPMENEVVHGAVGCQPFIGRVMGVVLKLDLDGHGSSGGYKLSE